MAGVNPRGISRSNIGHGWMALLAKHTKLIIIFLHGKKLIDHVINKAKMMIFVSKFRTRGSDFPADPDFGPGPVIQLSLDLIIAQFRTWPLDLWMPLPMLTIRPRPSWLVVWLACGRIFTIHVQRTATMSGSNWDPNILVAPAAKAPTVPPSWNSNSLLHARRAVASLATTCPRTQTPQI